MNIILASASPRRVELLRAAGFDFSVIPANADETLPQGISTKEAVLYLAQKKAAAVYAQHADSVVIGSDTMVEINGEALGKPKNERDAERMLNLLSGSTHYVHTGVYFAGEGYNFGFTESCAVTFFPLSREEILNYIATGEPADKAGAYAIQGIGMRFVKGICGDYNTVVGLPAAKVARILNGLSV